MEVDPAIRSMVFGLLWPVCSHALAARITDRVKHTGGCQMRNLMNCNPCVTSLQLLVSAKICPTGRGARWLAFALFGLTNCADQVTVQGQQNDAVEYRYYTEGPLTAKDFQAPIPAFVKIPGQVAETNTDIRCEFKYRVYRTRGRSIARLSSIDIRAVVIPRKSWNRQPQNVRLMDHEQGHFDLAHIAALRAQRRLATSRPLSGSGTTPEQAVQDLQQQVDKRLQQIREELLAAHTAYDKVTRHGTVLGPQKEQRESQKKQIEELVKKK